MCLSRNNLPATQDNPPTVNVAFLTAQLPAVRQTKNWMWIPVNNAWVFKNALISSNSNPSDHFPRSKA